jgi:hypothetical protein
MLSDESVERAARIIILSALSGQEISARQVAVAFGWLQYQQMVRTVDIQVWGSDDRAI